MTPESKITVEEGEEINPSQPPLPKEYVEAGLTKVFDEELGWIIVNADGSKLWPIPHAAQYYYPQEKP